MSNIICHKCHLLAWGKCPKCRTVFTELYEYQMTEAEKNCLHNWIYINATKCIYGCNYETLVSYKIPEKIGR